MGFLIKTLSIFCMVTGVIWLNAKTVGVAVVWVVDYFERKDDLQAINKPLQAFYERLLEMNHSALIVQYGPWGLTISGTLLFVLIIIWQFFRGSQKSRRPEKLAQACENLAQEIRGFLIDRQSQGPQHHTDDLTDLTEQELDSQFEEDAIYSTQTNVLYEERIAPKLSDLYAMLIKSEHRPNEILTFEDVSWANRKIGKLTSYARIIRQGEKIKDGRARP